MASSTEPLHRAERSHRKTDEPNAGAARPPSRRRAKQAASAGERGGGQPEIILVGCGWQAQQFYLPALLTLQQTGAISVRAIVDPNEIARESCRKQFPQADVVSSLDAVVAPPDSLAIIATPARFHGTQSNAALKRGWHVLCANPLAASSHDGALMIAAAQRHERLLAIDLPQRFFPAVRYLKTLCHDHLLGPPIHFRIHEGTTRKALPASIPPGEKFESPDGVLHELGMPTLDLLTWCLGSASVLGYSDDAMGGVEANAFIELSFTEGARGTVHLSRDWPTEQSYTFVFERGIVKWDATRPARLIFQLGSAPAAIEGDLISPLSPTHSYSSAKLLATHEDAMLAEIQNILGAIAGRETLRVPATEAMHSLSIIEECHARRTPLPQPWLPQSEAVHARAFSPPGTLRRP